MANTSAAAELRRQVESALAGRFPSALSLRPPVLPELLSCGLPAVDDLLGGGLPLGAITEVTGADSSGRTTLALSTLAGVTGQGERCAYVDVSDALNPVSAAARGVDLGRLLWVRAGEPHAGKAAVTAGSPFSAATPVPAKESKRIGGRGGCHPRNEIIGFPHAASALFQSMPGEKTDFTPRCSEAQRRPPLQTAALAAVTLTPKMQGWPQSEFRARRERAWAQFDWVRLDQALRATDLLLSAGGFRALVLDMGDIPPAQARRVPLATWFRFRLQAEKSRTLFLLLSRVPCANSCAAVSLHCRQGAIEWQQATQHSPRLLTGFGYRVGVERNRAAALGKKPAAFAEAHWHSAASWSQ